MTAGNNAALAAAGKQRAQHTRNRAVDALRRLDAAGQNITFTGVAQAAAISRSWLYRQPDLRTEIDRLRRSHIGAEVQLPSAPRASDDSSRRRLEATLDEIQRLKTENHQLRKLVAQPYGRQAPTGSPDPLSATCPPRTRPATHAAADYRSR